MSVKLYHPEQKIARIFDGEDAIKEARELGFKHGDELDEETTAACVSEKIARVPTTIFSEDGSFGGNAPATPVHSDEVVARVEAAEEKVRLFKVKFDELQTKVDALLQAQSEAPEGGDEDSGEGGEPSDEDTGGEGSEGGEGGEGNDTGETSDETSQDAS